MTTSDCLRSLRGRLRRRAALLPPLALLLTVQLLVSVRLLSPQPADVDDAPRLRRSASPRDGGGPPAGASPTEVVTSSPDGRAACRCDLLSLDCLDAVACVGGGRDARSAAATARALLTRTTIRRMTEFDDEAWIDPYNFHPIGKVRGRFFFGWKVL